MKNKIILSLALISSCAPQWRYAKINDNLYQQKINVCVDVTYNEIVHQNIEAAFMTWNKALERWRYISVVYYGDDQLCHYNVKEVNYDNPENVYALAWTSLGKNNIWLRKGRYENKAYEIILHEFGHCLGAQHMQQTLMHPTYDVHYMRCPDKITVAQVAAYNRVSLDILSWCY